MSDLDPTHGTAYPGSRRADVVVVGAGITGLRVAHGLQKEGVAVVVLEARGRVGGRLRSIPGRLDGGAGSPRLDAGATWFWPGESRVRALVEELGLPTHAQYRAGDALYDDPRGVQRLTGNPIDAESLRFSAGADSLAEALAARLEQGTVQLSTPARRVHVGDDTVVVVGAGPDGAPIEMRAPHAVLALPPALAVHALEFSPDLPAELRRLASATPVWMGGTVKVVARYETPFWRDHGLSGAAISHVGPLREIHDMSGPGGDPPALFGFAQGGFAQVGLAQGDVTEEAVLRQLVRLFGSDAGEPVELELVDWSRERWTTPAGVPQTPRHDLYGHPLYRTPVAGRLHIVSTETAPAFAGHIEGALLAADEVVGRIRAMSVDEG